MLKYLTNIILIVLGDYFDKSELEENESAEYEDPEEINFDIPFLWR